jgi:hypothetical protein
MNITTAELLTILRAMSALETAYMVTLMQNNGKDGLLSQWDQVQQAIEILEQKIIGNSSDE